MSPAMGPKVTDPRGPGPHVQVLTASTTKPRLPTEADPPSGGGRDPGASWSIRSSDGLAG